MPRGTRHMKLWKTIIVVISDEDCSALDAKTIVDRSENGGYLCTLQRTNFLQDPEEELTEEEYNFFKVD